MKAAIKVMLLNESGEKFFGEGPCRLLRAVERTGSLRAAAASMEMAYSKATRLLRQAENSLGFPLTVKSTGGRAGGGSVLTPEGERWLARYEAYRDACIRADQELYRRYFPKAGCVIMASGFGKRFGGNKLMADFHGEPLICRVLDATEGLFDRRVVVTRYEAVAQLARQRNADVILHELPHRNDTVRLGLEGMEDMDGCMFLPGDQPLLRRETVAMLLDAWKKDPDRILRPVCADTVGSPVLFPAWAFPELRVLPEGKGGAAVIGNHSDRVCLVPVADPLELADADTPERLEALKGVCHD